MTLIRDGRSNFRTNVQVWYGLPGLVLSTGGVTGSGVCVGVGDQAGFTVGTGVCVAWVGQVAGIPSGGEIGMARTWGCRGSRSSGRPRSSSPQIDGSGLALAKKDGGSGRPGGWNSPER